MHWGDMGSWGWVGALVGTVFMLVLVGLLVAVIVVALRGVSDSRGGGGAAPSSGGGAAPSSGGGAAPSSGGAEQVLAERFARGEIDEEEFQQRRRVLRGG